MPGILFMEKTGVIRLKMGELFRKVIRREMEDGTYRRYDVKKRTIFQEKGPAVQ